MKPVAVIGLGNPLMTDEGVGVRVVEALQKNGALLPEVDVLDLGTAGLTILHYLGGRDKVIFVDCALMGEHPGAFRRFTPEEVNTRKVRTRLSLHEGDLLHTLSLARQLGECPGSVVVFGIEPQSVEMGEGLSPPLRERFDEYVEVVAKEAGIQRPATCDVGPSAFDRARGSLHA